jgi:hypothetical protein
MSQSFTKDASPSSGTFFAHSVGRFARTVTRGVCDCQASFGAMLSRRRDGLAWFSMTRRNRPAAGPQDELARLSLTASRDPTGAEWFARSAGVRWM